MEPQHSFKGVWIPKAIWLNPELSPLDKMVYAEIWALEEEDGCFASNEYLAGFCQCSVRKVAQAIQKLKDLGFVQQVKFDGRIRWLKCYGEGRVANSATQTCKKCKSDMQKMQVSIYNDENIEYNIEDIPPISPTGTEEGCSSCKAEFEKFWQHYIPSTTRDGSTPKGPKKLAWERYERIVKKGTKPEDILGGLEKYLAFCHQNGRFTCHAAVFLAQERWKDEYPDMNDDLGI